MNEKKTSRRWSRRDFLRAIGTGAAGLLGGGAVYSLLGGGGRRIAASVLSDREARAPGQADQTVHLAVTDGYISLPGRADPLYIFGFIDVPWAMPISDLESIYKGNVQMVSPIIGVDQENELHLKLTNLGLIARPDLDDAHTVHWHGFRNPIPLYDGVPQMTVAVPVGRSFTYAFRPHDPGTYIYHCHFEDTEHVQMAMIGLVYVRPLQNQGDTDIPQARLAGNTDPTAPLGYTYNDGVPPSDPSSTAYDREFSLLLTEIDQRPHDLLEAVQEFVWSEYDPQYWTINGRSYPDTIKVNNDPSLPHQPISSLVQANAGERVLLRLGHLGYQQHTMHLPGIPLKVVGHDATHMEGPDGADLTYWTNSVYIAPSVTRDALFTAPDFNPDAPTESDAYGNYNTYWFKNRNYERQTNDGLPGLGGMVTEVRIYDGGLPMQEYGHQMFPELAPPFPPST